MGKKVFTTYIKPNHELSGNDYVRGRIRGIMNGICERYDIEGIYGNAKDSNGGFTFHVKCTAWRYRKFMKIINTTYPGLCRFDCTHAL